jgi:hypothetical protein
MEMMGAESSKEDDGESVQDEDDDDRPGYELGREVDWAMETSFRLI